MVKVKRIGLGEDAWVLCVICTSCALLRLAINWLNNKWSWELAEIDIRMPGWWTDLFWNLRDHILKNMCVPTLWPLFIYFCWWSGFGRHSNADNHSHSFEIHRWCHSGETQVLVLIVSVPLVCMCVCFWNCWMTRMSLN